MAKLCMGCMNPLPEGSDRCSICGFSAEDSNPGHCLAIATVLQDHYIVGRCMGEGSDSVLYIGYDRLLKEPCLIQEFYPSTLCERAADGRVQPLGGCERPFAEYAGDFRGVMRALARAKDVPGMIPVYDIFDENGTAYAVSDYCAGATLSKKLRQAGGVKENLLSTLAKWFKAQCILLSVTFVELLLGLLLIRQPYALLLAAIIAVIDALPVFGTGTFLLPWAVMCLLLQQTPKAIALGAIYAVITLVRSFLEPKVMAAQVNLPPLAALIAMYIGFCTMGVTGMILFPVALLFLKQLQDAGYLHLWK